MTKTLTTNCATCGISSDEGEFPAPRPGRPRAYYCRACESARQNEWRKKQREENSEKFRRADKNTKLKIKFGITLEQYEEMLERQSGVCWICKRPEPTRALAVDHDHTTGAVRGLLCTACNNMLGTARENVDALKRAIRYIEEFKPLP
jgi:hypothetical protein